MTPVSTLPGIHVSRLPKPKCSYYQLYQKQ